VTAYICETCGVQYQDAPGPPPRCIICEDERQYVPPGGQRWTTLEEMCAKGSRNEFRELEPGLIAIRTQPQFAIGQRALLVSTDHGNFLWDSLSYIDDETIRELHGLGGIQAISVSHPHFYGSMVEWSHAFGGVPVYVPEDDEQWVTRPDSVIRWYKGTVHVFPGVRLIQCGGHFEGSAVLHWAHGAGGKGAILTGDTIAPARDRRWVTFMRSYPNYIPLPEHAVRRIVETVEPYEFDRLYGGWIEVTEDAKQAVRRSAERYIRWLRGVTTEQPAEEA
jgi:glyoxylase-like metal-dependent hydrolase (beta-lactamase superfamily II)